ncbi:MAG: SUMF1/EgtB/PvdO family nonheme iron enzyme [Bacteroidaceae bacterium]|nr:SUMF1/EgtB/PvdO family nonheme iron enzyme [Bacteroidaceae bacterium]
MEDVNRLLPVGTLLRNGTYRIERSIGSGGFGNTYMVRHLGLDAEMVVKEFFMKGINLRAKDNTVTVSVPDNRVTYESQREKFKKEAQRLWKLKSDHIVGVHDIFEENGTVYYVMDFIEGESLDDRLKRETSPLTEREVTAILNQILDALEVIHNNKPTPIFHLDIKPNNILMSPNGTAVLIDFGASKQLSGDHEGVTSTTMTYTKGYAPSEQMDGRSENIGAWTDLYALGATLYKLLTSNQPPEPSDVINEGADAFSFTPQVSSKLTELILWMMQPSRKRRPQSVSEVRQWLKSHTESDYSNTSQPVTEKNAEPADNPHSDSDETVICSTESTSARRESNAQVMERTNVYCRSFTVNGVSFKMIRVEGGIFTMGATYEQGSDVESDEKPAHQVTLSSYYIGETVVTQALWQAVMGTTVLQQRNKANKEWPLRGVGTNYPMYYISWDECQEFVRKLNSLTGKNFRLLTEAEWEYAARGGNKSQGYKYSGSSMLGNVAWYTQNSGDETHPVKTKSPNELGIYNMSGNVWEWCQDWYGSYDSSFLMNFTVKYLYQLFFLLRGGTSSQTNPTGPSSGRSRVCRGGSWCSSLKGCRVSRRGSFLHDDRSYNLGMRLAL